MRGEVKRLGHLIPGGGTWGLGPQGTGAVTRFSMVHKCHPTQLEEESVGQCGRRTGGQETREKAGVRAQVI